MSKIKLFKDKLQESYCKVLDTKISKSETDELFKATFDTLVEFVLNSERQSLAISNIGKVVVMKCKPAGQKVKKYKFEFDPRIKFYFAKNYSKKVYDSFGLASDFLDIVGDNEFDTEEVNKEEVVTSAKSETTPVTSSVKKSKVASTISNVKEENKKVNIL